MTYEDNVISIASMMARKHHARSFTGREGIEQYQQLHQRTKDKWIALNRESAEIAINEIKEEVKYLLGCQGKTEEFINSYLLKRGLIK